MGTLLRSAPGASAGAGGSSSPLSPLSSSSSSPSSPSSSSPLPSPPSYGGSSDFCRFASDIFRRRFRRHRSGAHPREGGGTPARTGWHRKMRIKPECKCASNATECETGRLPRRAVRWFIPTAQPHPTPYRGVHVDRSTATVPAPLPPPPPRKGPPRSNRATHHVRQGACHSRLVSDAGRSSRTSSEVTHLPRPLPRQDTTPDPSP